MRAINVQCVARAGTCSQSLNQHAPLSQCLAQDPRIYPSH